MQGFPFWKKKRKPTKRRTKRFWIREYLKKTGEIWSVPHTVFRVKPIRSDREYFFRYIRMSPKRNRRYPDRLGWTGTNLENWARFYFPDASQISAMVGDHSREMRTQICTVGTSAMDFAHYQSPKLLGSSPPITNKHGVSRESGTDFWRLSDISAKSGMVGKK